MGGLFFSLKLQEVAFEDIIALTVLTEPRETYWQVKTFQVFHWKLYQHIIRWEGPHISNITSVPMPNLLGDICLCFLIVWCDRRIHVQMNQGDSCPRGKNKQCCTIQHTQCSLKRIYASITCHFTMSSRHLWSDNSWIRIYKHTATSNPVFWV